MNEQNRSANNENLNGVPQDMPPRIQRQAKQPETRVRRADTGAGAAQPQTPARRQDVQMPPVRNTARRTPAEQQPVQAYDQRTRKIDTEEILKTLPADRAQHGNGRRPVSSPAQTTSSSPAPAAGERVSARAGGSPANAGTATVRRPVKSAGNAAPVPAQAQAAPSAKRPAARTPGAGAEQQRAGGSGEKKKEKGSRTVTDVRLLGEDDRMREITRINVGTDTTDLALSSAGQMLDACRARQKMLLAEAKRQ